MRTLIILVTLLAFPALGPAATIKVPDDYPAIQMAINAAAGGDTVIVAPGIYVENIDFLGKAIALESSDGPDVTIIDGGNPSNPDFGTVVYFQNGEGSDSVLDGFTITNGTGTHCPPPASYIWGGGIICEGASPVIRNNIIKNNFGGSSGGGIYCDASKAYIYNNKITDNVCDGVFAYGGGICVLNKSDVLIVNNIITRHILPWCMSSAGAGIYFGDSKGTVANSIIAENVIDEAYYKTVGAGICADEGSAADVVNCTILNNIIWDYGSVCGPDQIYLETGTVFNSIIWDYTLGSGWQVAGTTVVYSDVQYGYPGTGNIDSDPLLVDQAIGDYHLTFNSPCRGSGDNSVITEFFDFEGDPRIHQGAVDMGADEFYTHLYWTGDATPGGNVEIKFVDLPGTAPVALCIGTGVLDPPLKSMWGDWYLMFPILGPIGMPQIPSTGVLVIPGNIPGTPSGPYSIPMQALIGAELSNLSVLEVE